MNVDNDMSAGTFKPLVYFLNNFRTIHLFTELYCMDLLVIHLEDKCVDEKVCSFRKHEK